MRACEQRQRVHPHLSDPSAIRINSVHHVMTYAVVPHLTHFSGIPGNLRPVVGIRTTNLSQSALTRSEHHASQCRPDDVLSPKRARPPTARSPHNLRHPDGRIEHREEEDCDPRRDCDAHDEDEDDEYEVPCGRCPFVRWASRSEGGKRTDAAVVIVPGQLDDESNDGEERNPLLRWRGRIWVLRVRGHGICRSNRRVLGCWGGR